MKNASTWFDRTVLPALAFKAVVIGGGYATGRELATFFLPSGPRGGLFGMAAAMVIWSVVCAVTFLFAMQTGSRDYRSFFSQLLGPVWPAFEIAYMCALVLILAVFAAAAGAIGHALFAWPSLIGASALVMATTLFTTFGNAAVERLFKYVSIFLYVTYALFLVLSALRFGNRILAEFATPAPSTGWFMGGVTYAGYNILGAVVILPVTRHLRSRRDAVVAGALAGPSAMLPAMLFFLAMGAFYPAIQNQTLPSDFLLGQLHLPIFRLVFQAMIFAALVESGTCQVHAINERVSSALLARGRPEFGRFGRLALTVVILIFSVFAADRIGLITLIAQGYRYLAYLFLAVFVAPLLTLGLWRVVQGWRSIDPNPANPIRAD